MKLETTCCKSFEMNFSKFLYRNVGKWNCNFRGKRANKHRIIALYSVSWRKIFIAKWNEMKCVFLFGRKNIGYRADYNIFFFVWAEWAIQVSPESNNKPKHETHVKEMIWLAGTLNSKNMCYHSRKLLCPIVPIPNSFPNSQNIQRSNVSIYQCACETHTYTAIATFTNLNGAEWLNWNNQNNNKNHTHVSAFE